MIEKGADNWNRGLDGACFGGHLDIVKFMIEKGANEWNRGLFYACYGGHLDIVKFLIEKGANVCEFCDKSMPEHLK
jgi:ankyrin repeat protein